MQDDYDGDGQQLALDSALEALAPFRIPLDALQFEDQLPIGRGGYAKVRRAIWNKHGGGISGNESLEVAVKELLPDQSKPLRLALRLTREMRLWSSLNHRNILEFCGFHLELDQTEAYLISPFLRRGSLRLQIKAPDTTIEQRLHWMLGITEGLTYLHTFTPPIVHGDVKADNVLPNDNDDAVLCDFGLSSMVEQTVPSGLTTSKGFKGTLRWCAPELLEDKPRSLASDVWAWGLTILETITGRIPYYRYKSDRAVLLQIVSTTPGRDHYPELSPDHELWNIVVQCWSNPADRRIRIEQCHSLLKQTKCIEAISPPLGLDLLTEPSSAGQPDSSASLPTINQSDSSPSPHVSSPTTPAPPELNTVDKPTTVAANSPPTPTRLASDSIESAADATNASAQMLQTSITLSERVLYMSKLIAELQANEKIPLSSLKRFQIRCDSIRNDVESLKSQAQLGKRNDSQDNAAVAGKLNGKIDKAVEGLLKLRTEHVQRMQDQDRPPDRVDSPSFKNLRDLEDPLPPKAGNLALKASNIIRETSGRWLNPDPRHPIQVGDYGKIDPDGRFIPHGNIYDSEEVRVAIPDLHEQPPQIGEIAQEEKLKSKEAVSWSFDLDPRLSVENVLDGTVQLRFEVETGRRAAFLISKTSRTDHLPTDRLLRRLSDVKELSNMYLITERTICHGYRFGITTVGRNKASNSTDDNVPLTARTTAATEGDTSFTFNAAVQWSVVGNKNEFTYVPTFIATRMNPYWVNKLLDYYPFR